MKNIFIYLGFSLILSAMFVSCDKSSVIEDTQVEKSILLRDGVLIFESHDHFLKSVENEEVLNQIKTMDFTSFKEELQDVVHKNKDERFEYREKSKSFEVNLPYLDLLPLLNEDGLVNVGETTLVYRGLDVYSVPSEKLESIDKLMNGQNVASDKEVFHSPIIVNQVSEDSRLIEGGCWKAINTGLWCDDSPSFGYVMFTDNISYQYAVSIKDCEHKKSFDGCTVWNYRLINKTTYYQYDNPTTLDYEPASDLWYTFNPRIKSSVVRSGHYGAANFKYNRSLDNIQCDASSGICVTTFINLMDQASLSQNGAFSIPIYNVDGVTEVTGGMSVPFCIDAILPCEFNY